MSENLTLERQKEGERSENTTVFLYHVWMSVNTQWGSGGWNGDKEDEISEKKGRADMD